MPSTPARAGPDYRLRHEVHGDYRQPVAVVGQMDENFTHSHCPDNRYHQRPHQLDNKTIIGECGHPDNDKENNASKDNACCKSPREDCARDSASCERPYQERRIPSR